MDFIFLNARTADHPDYDITTANDYHLPVPDDVLFQTYSNIEKRVSKDIVINENGKRLLQFCK